MQVQAVISKLGREANSLRDKLIAQEKVGYVPSDNAKKLAALLEERDRLKALSEKASDDAKKFADDLGITGYYAYSKADEALEKLKTKEIEGKYPKVDLEAATDDLIIESVEDDFNVESFIEYYLNKVRNG